MPRTDGVREPGLSLTALIYQAVRKRLGHVVAPVRVHALRPSILRGYAFMEAGQEGAKSLPASLKKLAQVRVATRVGCPF